MKRILLASALTIAMAVPAFAENSASNDFGKRQTSNERRAEKIIGMDVRNSQNQDLGSVSDIILSDSGGARFAVLSVGGFLGIGDKQVAVDWNDLKFDRSRNLAVIDLTKDQLQAAPTFAFNDQANTNNSAGSSGSSSDTNNGMSGSTGNSGMKNSNQ